MCTSYVASRKDMIDIEKNWGEKFLVAELEIGKSKKVVGTLLYSFETPHAPKFFNGEKLGKLLELFSISTDKRIGQNYR